MGAAAGTAAGAAAAEGRIRSWKTHISKVSSIVIPCSTFMGEIISRQFLTTLCPLQQLKHTLKSIGNFLKVNSIIIVQYIEV